jgi:hypothetical protein
MRPASLSRKLLEQRLPGLTRSAIGGNNNHTSPIILWEAYPLSLVIRTLPRELLHKSSIADWMNGCMTLEVGDGWFSRDEG